METVVVGVDGSEPARAALEFAAAEAALRGARLRIVSAWEVPPAVYAGGAGFAPVPEFDQSTLHAIRESAEKILSEALEQGKKLQPNLEYETRVSQGQPAQVLLDEGRDAALIVVGNRGRGGFSSLLLGSVSQQVVHHASCPVTVVRHRGDAG